MGLCTLPPWLGPGALLTGALLLIPERVCVLTPPPTCARPHGLFLLACLPGSESGAVGPGGLRLSCLTLSLFS